MDAYIEDFFEFKNLRSSTKISRTILDEKYEKENLNKLMKKNPTLIRIPTEQST